MAASRPHTFTDLGVPQSLSTLLAANGITVPTPIQTLTLPDSIAGRDVLGRGQTGSGKTYAFLLPLLTRLSASAAKRQPGRPRALILAPTRELATQIEASLVPLAQNLRLSTLTIFGGVASRPQISALRGGVDIVVACPGRLNELVEARHARLDAIEITVLDEADHMADLGFLPVVRRLMSQTPRSGQRLLFSATLDGDIDVLVRQFMHKPVTHSVDSALSPVSTMEHHVLHLHRDDRLPVLIDLASAPGRTLVFTRTKYGAKKLTRQLNSAGVPAVELHGNLAQNARNRNLQAFSDGTTRTLVATDIAARGIHVDDIELVIHADPPMEHKAYLHRSGRTARAGAGGTVITLTTDEQVRDVRDLTRKAGVTPTTTQVRPGDAILTTLAPGERKLVQPSIRDERSDEPSSSRAGRGRSGRAPRSTQTQRTAPTRASQPQRSTSARAGEEHRSAPARTGQQPRAAATRSSGQQQRPAQGERSGSGQPSAQIVTHGQRGQRSGQAQHSAQAQQPGRGQRSAPAIDHRAGRLEAKVAAPKAGTSRHRGAGRAETRRADLPAGAGRGAHR